MLKVAIVGCGGFAQVHAGLIKQLAPKVEVTGLCEVEPERLERFAQQHFPDARRFGSFDELIASDLESDAVVLITPHTLHYPQAKAAMNRGWHVIVEKPMVTRSDQAVELWRLAESTGKRLMIAFPSCFCREFRAIRTLRQQGVLEGPQVISGWIAQRWLPAVSNTWRVDPALSGGGQMYDSGAHLLNSILWIMDEPVVEVACFVNNCGAAVDINGVAIMRFESGAVGSVGIGGNTVGWDSDLRLQTRRTILRTSSHGGFLEVKYDGQVYYPPVDNPSQPAQYSVYQNLIDTLAGTDEPMTTPRHGLLLSRLMDAFYASAASGRAVKVEPVPLKLG